MRLSIPTYRYPTLIECLVFAFSLWEGIDIVNQWDGSPFMRMAEITFLIWIIPFVLYWIFFVKKEREMNTCFLLGAIVMTTVGMLGSMNAFLYIGLSLAICGLVPLSLGVFFWFLSSSAWMPALAYFLSHFEVETVTLIRLIVSSIGSLIALSSFIFRRNLRATQ